MAYFINEECISCGACEPECPTNAISEGDGKFVIDAATCIDCAACADLCPVDAIHKQQISCKITRYVKDDCNTYNLIWKLLCCPGRIPLCEGGILPGQQTCGNLSKSY